MKKLLENFHILSKSAFSVILLFCLIGALYLLYENYQDEDLNYEKKATVDQQLKKDINKNSNLINKISNQIDTNKNTLNEINKNIKLLSKKNNADQLLDLNKSITVLNKNFNILSLEIEKLKDIKSTTNFNKVEKNINPIDKGKKDILDLIMIKYENNLSFETEFEYLKKTLSNDNFAIVEKISLLKTKPYKGNNYVQEIFDQEVSFYLKKIINKNPNSFFSKFILPFIQVSPTSENQINNDFLLKVKKIKLNLDNRNIQKVNQIIISIEDYKNIFPLSNTEIEKYLNFKKELTRLE